MENIARSSLHPHFDFLFSSSFKIGRAVAVPRRHMLLIRSNMSSDLEGRGGGWLQHKRLFFLQIRVTATSLRVATTTVRCTTGGRNWYQAEHHHHRLPLLLVLFSLFFFNSGSFSSSPAVRIIHRPQSPPARQKL